MIKVSIIIPVYNVAPYLKKALDSVMYQTLKEIEIICIDDCSTDNSLSILKEYAEIDTRFKIVELDQNSGAAIARNKALEIAKGKYLGFIDPDDYIDLNYYEELYKKAIEDGADIVKCPIKEVSINNVERIGKCHEQIKKKGYKEFFSYEWTTAIYKSSLIFDNEITFPEECIKGQDSIFLAKCVFRANKLSLIDHVFYHYIRRQNSLDDKNLSLEKLNSNIRAHSLIINEINISDLLHRNKQIYAKLYFINLIAFISISFRNQSIEAKDLAVSALITGYENCKANKELETYFNTKFLKLIKKKDKNLIIQKLLNLKNDTDIYKSSLLQNIFSVQNQNINEKFKLVSIFGLKIRLRNKRDTHSA